MIDNRKIKPANSKNRVNQAGNAIRNKNATEQDYEVIENWRTAHNKILNDWQSTLRKKIKKEKNNKIVFAQRHKRRITIFDKLEREPKMQLARMHDIAGCRLIFQNENDLQNFRQSLYKQKTFKHKLKDPYDYVAKPKNSGYRGIHDIWQYIARPKKDKYWDGLLIEIQYRTKYQHLWATAVEISDLLQTSRIKFGEGTNDTKEFFRLTSEIIARAFEDRKSVYNNLSNKELLNKFDKIDKKTKLLRQLKMFKIFSEGLSKRDFCRGGVILHYKEKSVRMYAFRSFNVAQQEYLKIEKEIPITDDLVLVKVKSKKDLKIAYKNYFGDAKDFVKIVEEGIKKLST